MQVVVFLAHCPAPESLFLYWHYSNREHLICGSGDTYMPHDLPKTRPDESYKGGSLKAVDLK
jgi:hypothetical protein